MAKKILVVDDEQVIHDVIQDLLEFKGYTVDHAYNGEEAVEKVKLTHPDLIILDINVPKITGCAVSTLLSEDDSTRDIPIIFLTGYIDQKEAETLDHNLSGQLLVTKPFNVDDLISAIEKILGKLPE